MRHPLFSVATAILGAALLTPHATLQAQASASTTSTKSTTATKRRARRRPVKKGPTVEQQIQSLRDDMQTQIQTLRQQLSDRDAQLQQAQAAAAAAQASAQQAQQQSAQQAQTLTENTTAVSSLQGAVTDLKSSSSSMQTAFTERQQKLEKKVDHPDSITYKGITLSPQGSFTAAETVYRNRATGGDIPTAFTSVPLENQDQNKISEFYGTARQSRIALSADGTSAGGTKFTGYYEADWLGTGVTSNNNQSNSYVFRQRQIWGRAALPSGLSFTAGQTWSLATEYRKGLQTKNENVPLTIDPNYVAGFVWARQYGARVVQSFGDKISVGFSVENPQTITPAGSGLPSNYLIGSAGVSGGLYNSAGAPGATSSGNLTSYSFNLAPDMIAKIAVDPGFGHYEVFGIGRFFRDRIYPNETFTTTSYCYNTTTKVIAPVTGTCPTGTSTVSTSTASNGNTTGAFNDKTVGGGIGGSLLVPATKYVNVGVKGLWGDGIGRYGSSQIADLTLRPNAQLALIHGYSAMATLEVNPTPRLQLYAYYSGDGTMRRYFFTNATRTAAEGFGSYLANQSGCFTEVAPANTPTAGYTPGGEPGSCTANTRAVAEYTLGYWYDFYKGEKGRFRQGIQYSYIDRYTWSGAANTVGGAPKGTDAVLETSFRYYLP